MNEKVFRAKLDTLGARYSVCISRRNVASQAPHLWAEWHQRAQSVLDEIKDLERRYRSQGGYARLDHVGENDTDVEVWRQRLANKLDEGAHPDVISYVEKQIAALEPQLSVVEPANPWLDYHDQLIKEWFDGERALVDDLYPSKPKLIRAPRNHRSSALGRAGSDLAEFGRVFGLVVLITALVVWANWVLQVFAWH